METNSNEANISLNPQNILQFSFTSHPTFPGCHPEEAYFDLIAIMGPKNMGKHTPGNLISENHVILKHPITPVLSRHDRFFTSFYFNYDT